MHVDAWLERLADGRRRAARPPARGAGRARRRTPATVFTPLPGEPALVAAGILAAPMGRAREPLAGRDQPDARSASACRCRCRRPAIRRAARTRPRRGVPLAVGRVHDGPPVGGRARRGDRRRERRARAGRARRGHRRSTEAAVRATLAEVPDPEIPMVSVVDLGLVHARRGRRRTRDPGRAPADVRRLPGARADPRRRSPTRSPASAARSRSRSRSRSRGRRDRITPAGRDRAARPPASPRRPSPRTSAARTAARPGSRWTTRSARPSAGRSSTAATAASRSKRSSRSDGPGAVGAARPIGRRSSVPGRWAPGSPSSPSRRATRSSSHDVDTAAIERGDATGSATGSAGAPCGSSSTRTRSTTGSTAGSTGLRGTDVLEQLADEADLVIEAALEDLELKQAIFRALDGVERRRRRSSRRTRARCRSPRSPRRPTRPERVVGLHFFNPAPVMRARRGRRRAARPRRASSPGERPRRVPGARRRSAPRTARASSSTGSTARSRSRRCGSSRRAPRASRRSTARSAPRASRWARSS